MSILLGTVTTITKARSYIATATIILGTIIQKKSIVCYYFIFAVNLEHAATIVCILGT